MKRFFFLLVCFGLFGCSPVSITETYYIPSGTSGKTALNLCYGRGGFPKKYQLTLGGIKEGSVSTSLNKQGNEVILRLFLEIEKNKSIDFPSRTLEVFIGDKKFTHRFDKIVAFNPSEVKIVNGEFLGLHDVSKQTEFSGAVYEAYYFSTKFEMRSEEFTVRFPRFSVNSEIMDIGEIHFIRKSSTAVLPGNCP